MNTVTLAAISGVSTEYGTHALAAFSGFFLGQFLYIRAGRARRNQPVRELALPGFTTAGACVVADVLLRSLSGVHPRIGSMLIGFRCGTYIVYSVFSVLSTLMLWSGPVQYGDRTRMESYIEFVYDGNVDFIMAVAALFAGIISGFISAFQ